MLRPAMKGSIDLMTPAMAVQKELMAIPDFGASEEEGLFVKEKNALEKIISDEPYRELLIKMGPKRSALFSWHKTAAAYKKIIEEQFTV